jgi:hypothetical protein
VAAVPLTPDQRQAARLRIVEMNEIVEKLEALPPERIKTLRLERFKVRCKLLNERSDLINSLTGDAESIGGRRSMN